MSDYINYRKPNKIKFQVFTEEQELYHWNQNTENFEKVIVNSQEEINKYEGQDLKSFMLRNGIIPMITDKQPAYINECDFKDISLSSVYDSLNQEVIQDNGDFMENLAKAQAIENEAVKQESNNSTKVKEDNYLNLKINKETGEVIK